MNFTRFPATTTNIFPIANSKTGGQLLTEFNLRSRESVMTDQNVEYIIGPSYTHNQDDFIVRIQQDELGVAISSTTLEITSGRALVNGHYIESQTNVVVDLAEANRELKSNGYEELKGHLAIGLRAMYSTEQTLSASMKAEDNQNLMSGIQIVILPVGKIATGYFVTPPDSPDTDELVTAHLLLADFYYINGQIRSITQNEKKTVAIDANRVGSFENLLKEHYLTKDGLNPKKIYTMAGKSDDGKTISGKPTWCDSTDSLFIWQKASKLTTTTVDPKLEQAEFGINDKEEVTLTLPHKTVDGKMWNAAGQQEYYEPRVMTLPQANYISNTPGTITSDYTKNIKQIQTRINEYYALPNGKQRAYIEELSEGRSELPKINYSTWSIGDYVLVVKDNSVVDGTNSLIQAPSTIYSVIPPQVGEVTFFEMTERLNGEVEEPPVDLDGVELFHAIYSYPGSLQDDEATIASQLSEWTQDKARYNELLAVEDSNYRGTYRRVTGTSVQAYGVNDNDQEVSILLEGDQFTYQDYIVVEINDVPKTVDGKVVKSTRYYYYKVTKTNGTLEYSDPILLTGTIPLATEDTIGGFLNVPDTQLDAGYVYRDENGNLRLLDYALLRSGVVAYQLGEDQNFGSGLSADEIQDQLNEYVNNRVAFLDDTQLAANKASGSPTNVINIELDLSKSDSLETITLENIDSRWGTSVYLKLSGTANSNMTINIKNCAKIRVSANFETDSDESVVSGTPTINVYNSCLFYDSTIIDYVHSSSRTYASSNSSIQSGQVVYSDGFNGFENLTIWFERFDNDDPNLIVDGMTVTELDTPIIPDDIDFWSQEVINDNHYYYGLQSITLDPQGDIVGCGLYMRNDMSANIAFGNTIALAQFTLPQGSGLTYPETSMTKQLKITGNFVTAYSTADPVGYIVMETEFTGLTQVYASSAQGDETSKGAISFLSKSMLVDDFISIDGLENGAAIDGWESNSYHVFKGYVIG